jgi:hypothetical protein
MAAQNSLTNCFICSKKRIPLGICIYGFKRNLAKGYFGFDSYAFFIFDSKKIKKGGKQG